MPLHPQARLAIDQWIESGQAIGGLPPDEIRAQRQARELAPDES